MRNEHNNLLRPFQEEFPDPMTSFKKDLSVSRVEALL
jgi:hypothetical protein